MTLIIEIEFRLKSALSKGKMWKASEYFIELNANWFRLTRNQQWWTLWQTCPIPINVMKKAPNSSYLNRIKETILRPVPLYLRMLIKYCTLPKFFGRMNEKQNVTHLSTVFGIHWHVPVYIYMWKAPIYCRFIGDRNNNKHFEMLSLKTVAGMQIHIISNYKLVSICVCKFVRFFISSYGSFIYP